ncbi:MAG: CheR family methyltransferase [Bacteroidales bacterium]
MDTSNVNTGVGPKIPQELTDKEFRTLSDYINRNIGIKLPDHKKVMVQSRLMKRVRELGLDSYASYFEMVFSARGQTDELIHMLDVITTNKTDFFRESVHFDFLRDQVLPEFQQLNIPGGVKIWSAGCSSGEEPYTIGITMEEYNAANRPLNYRIIGTDLSTRILKMAKNAVYTEQRVADIPLALKKKYFLKSKDPSRQVVRVIPALRAKTDFRRLNFMDDHYHMQESFDVVFCRNVLIYFERHIQEAVINKLCRHLKPGGFFFLGHSESIMRMTVPLEQIKPTIFRRT